MIAMAEKNRNDQSSIWYLKEILFVIQIVGLQFDFIMIWSFPRTFQQVSENDFIQKGTPVLPSHLSAS